jgi:glycosyltransferase involved in cell wall biosynthesis
MRSGLRSIATESAMSKVLLVPAHSTRTVGGPSRYVQALSAALSTLAHDTSVLEWAGDRHWMLEELRYMHRVEPDAIHVHGRLRSLVPALLYRRNARKRCRVVFTFHTQPITRSYLPGAQAPKNFSRFETLLARRLLNRCDAVTTVSGSIVEALNEHYGFGVRRYTVIGSGAWPTPPSDGVTDIVPRLKSRGAIPTLATIGVLAWDWKAAGHLIAIEATAALARRFPAVKLLVAGDGRYRRVLEDGLRERGAQRQVELLGNVDTSALLRAADVYVHMGLNEGCPLALVEAAMAGCPIVAARRGGIPEMFEHGVTAMLVEPDPAEVARTIERLLDEPDTARELGRRAREHAHRHWSWPAIATRYAEVYGG